MLELVAILTVVVLVGVIYATNKAIQRKVMRKHGGDAEAALDDAEEPLPSAHVITDDDTDFGDTKEAHEELGPRDLPVDHPGRDAAEAQASEEGGTTEGDADPGRTDRDDRVTKDDGGKDEGYGTSSPTASQARSD